MGTAELARRTAVVTGGGRGIGRAIAIALAQASAHVAVLARSRGELDETVRLIKAAGGHARAIMADVVDEQAIEQVIRAVEVELGPSGVLVNNAGLIGPIAPFASGPSRSGSRVGPSRRLYCSLCAAWQVLHKPVSLEKAAWAACLSSFCAASSMALAVL